MLYIHRSARVLESLEFDIFYNAYNAMDKQLTNEHWTDSGITQMCYFVGRPSGFWFCRNDGVLIWLSYMVKENINAANRMLIGGTSGKVLSCGVMPRAGQYDQLWVVVEKTINGQTCRFVEYMNDDPIVPERDDFVGVTDSEAGDDLAWRNAMFEVQKQFVNVDDAIGYDGSDIGAAAGAALTPAPLAIYDTVTTQTIVASAPVFTASMVGQQIWKKAINGIGMGRALILSVTNSTTVVCSILTPFDSLTTMAAGNWYLTSNVLSGAWHLNNELVSIVADGGEGVPQTVVNGAITLPYQSSVFSIGKGYSGFIKSMHLASMTPQVPSDGRKMIVNRVACKLLNTLGLRYGTNLNKMQDFQFAQESDLIDRPSPLFSGHIATVVEDSSDLDKHFYLQQIHPLPCTIEEITVFTEFDEQ